MASVDDQATDIEILVRESSIREVVERRKETPEFNDDGERICLDCGDEIIKERVRAVDAVRCVTCQRLSEIWDRNYA